MVGACTGRTLITRARHNTRAQAVRRHRRIRPCSISSRALPPDVHMARLFVYEAAACAMGSSRSHGSRQPVSSSRRARVASLAVNLFGGYGFVTRPSQAIATPKSAKSTRARRTRSRRPQAATARVSWRGRLSGGPSCATPTWPTSGRSYRKSTSVWPKPRSCRCTTMH